MSVELFLWLLLTSIIINIPLAEFVKNLMKVANLPYRKNIIPFYTSITVCTGVGVVYRIPFGLGFEIIQVVRLVMLVLFTWMYSMLIYDKVKQTKKQHQRYKMFKKGERKNV